MRIYLHDSLHSYPRTTIAWAELPSCVTPLLNYYERGVSGSINLVKPDQLLGLSAIRLVRGENKRVLEYQPVVHRLRLTASS